MLARQSEINSVLIIFPDCTLHRLISASFSRWMTFGPAEVPILPDGKCCALPLLNIIPKFSMEDPDPRPRLSMCSIYMVTKGYNVFFVFFSKTLSIKKGVCDESPPKRWTVAETFAWRLSWLRNHLTCQHTAARHGQQSERQNIIDRMHTWQQCSVTISEDILTTKYDFSLR